MLPRASRLHRGPDISGVSRQGSRARVGALSVTVRSRRPGLNDAAVSTSATARACVVVGRPVGSAVVRNRQRRRLRHLLAEVLPDVSADQDLVVRAGAGVAELSTPALRAALVHCLDRAQQRERHR